MKSLQTIQKTFGVFQVLTKIAMILCFVWAGLALVGMLCGIVWLNGGNVVGADPALLTSLTDTNGLLEMTGLLLAETIMALTDATLLAFAFQYLRREQSDGTPFTMQGADQIRRLGIRTIVLPLVAAILIAVIYGVFDLPQNAAHDWSNSSSVATGITLILASLIFRYGAELEGKKAC